jgi:hypothetical protein
MASEKIGIREKLEQIAPYAGILSIALGFLYWIFNDGVTKREEDQHRTLTQLGSERWVYESLSRSLQQGRNISKALIRASQSHNDTDDKTVGEAQRELSYQANTIAFAQEFQSDIADLVQYGWRIKGLSERVDIGKPKRERITQIVHDSEELSDNLSNAGKEYRDKSKEIFGSEGVSVSSVTLDQVQRLQPYVDAYGKASRIGNRYIELSNALSNESGLIYAIAEERAKHASFVASITTPIGYLIYSLSAVIAFWGKWIEIKTGKKSTVESSRE